MGSSNVIEAAKSTYTYKALKIKNSTQGGLLEAENREKGALLPQSMSMAKHDMHVIKAMQQKQSSVEQRQSSQSEQKEEVAIQATANYQEVKQALATHLKPIEGIIEKHLKENSALKDNIYVAIVENRNGAVESQVVKKADANLQLLSSSQRNKKKATLNKSLDYHTAAEFSLKTPSQPAYETLKNKIDSYLREHRSSTFIAQARKQHSQPVLSDFLHKNSHNFLA